MKNKFARKALLKGAVWIGITLIAFFIVCGVNAFVSASFDIKGESLGLMLARGQLSFSEYDAFVSQRNTVDVLFLFAKFLCWIPLVAKAVELLGKVLCEKGDNEN